jgi:membrane-associated phospholipid phosphatase
MSCAPEWYNLGESCPSGTALPLSVTLPNDPNGWEIISVGYGYVPWLVCFSIAVLFLVYRGTREFAVGLAPCIAVGMNEVVKALVKQQRPIGSCLTSCGMPSSHSATSVALLVFLLLDAGYRVKPPAHRPSSLLADSDSMKESCSKFARGLCCLPFASITQCEYLVYFSFWMPLLMPVGISRVILSDHSASQVMAGSFIGMLVGFLWFGIVLWSRYRLSKFAGQKFLYIFIHNYDVPENGDSGSEESQAPLVVEGVPGHEDPINSV